MSQKRLGAPILVFQFVFGVFSFFFFFAVLFSGLDSLIIISAIVPLLINLFVSGWVAKENVRNGTIASLVYASPALLFSMFSLGDGFAYGNFQPFFFWFPCAIVVIIAGLIGVLPFYIKNRKKINNS